MDLLEQMDLLLNFDIVNVFPETCIQGLYLISLQ